MKDSLWLEHFLEKIAACSPEGRSAVEYVRRHNIRIGLKRARRSIGGFWTLTRGIYLNSLHYSQESALQNPRAWTLLVHEVRHLQQGPITALSIYGELEAWQVDFNVFKRITGKKLIPPLEELVSLPLNFDRRNLRRARDLMIQYAGRSYGARYLPLYPIFEELKYWVTRRPNS